MIDASDGPDGIVPTRVGKPRKGGKLKGLDIPDSAFFDPLPEDELAAWEGAYSNDPPWSAEPVTDAAKQPS